MFAKPQTTTIREEYERTVAVHAELKAAEEEAGRKLAAQVAEGGVAGQVAAFTRIQTDVACRDDERLAARLHQGYVQDDADKAAIAQKRLLQQDMREDNIVSAKRIRKPAKV